MLRKEVEEDGERPKEEGLRLMAWVQARACEESRRR